MSLEPSLVAKVIEVDRSLRAAGIGHAFGGAIALAYCAQPRATKDIDINAVVCCGAESGEPQSRRAVSGRDHVRPYCTAAAGTSVTGRDR